MVLSRGDRINLGAASCEAAPFFWRLPLNVYVHGSDDKPPVAHHILIVTPAAHLPGEEHPSEFFEPDGKPKEFPSISSTARPKSPTRSASTWWRKAWRRSRA